MNQHDTHYAEILQKPLPELRKQFGVKSLGLFGSYMRGQQQANSDLGHQSQVKKKKRLSRVKR